MFALACASMALFGIVHGCLGVIVGLPEMRARLHLDPASEGDLFLLLFLGVWTAYVTGGLLIDRFGGKLVLASSSFLFAVAMTGVAVAHSFSFAVPAALLLGMSGGGFNVSSSVLVSDLYELERGPVLVAINLFMALGALGFAFLAAALAGKLRLPSFLMVVVAVGMIHCVCCLFLVFPAPREAHAFSLRAALQVLKYPGVFLFAALLFFEAFNEIAVVGWTSTWMGAAGASSRYATSSVGVLQSSILLGRLMGIPLLRRVETRRMVTGCALGSLAGLVIMLISRSVIGMTVGVVIAGLSFAIIYPTVLAMARDRYQRFAGTLMGTMMATGTLGSMLGPWLVGHLPRAVPVHSGIAVPVGGAVILCFLMMVALRGGGAAMGSEKDTPAKWSSRDVKGDPTA
jgi:MFS family permease